MFEQNLPFINELSTATDFDDGEFRTNHDSYIIFREDIDMRITSFDGEITLLEFWEPSAFRTSEHSLTFLRSMTSNLFTNMDPKSMTLHINILLINDRPTLTLELAYYYQL